MYLHRYVASVTETIDATEFVNTEVWRIGVPDSGSPDCCSVFFISSCRSVQGIPTPSPYSLNEFYFHIVVLKEDLLLSYAFNSMELWEIIEVILYEWGFYGSWPNAMDNWCIVADMSVQEDANKPWYNRYWFKVFPCLFLLNTELIVRGLMWCALFILSSCTFGNIKYEMMVSEKHHNI